MNFVSPTTQEKRVRVVVPDTAQKCHPCRGRFFTGRRRRSCRPHGHIRSQSPESAVRSRKCRSGVPGSRSTLRQRDRGIASTHIVHTARRSPRIRRRARCTALSSHASAYLVMAYGRRGVVSPNRKIAHWEIQTGRVEIRAR